MNLSSGCCTNFSKSDQTINSSIVSSFPTVRFYCNECLSSYKCCTAFEFCVSCCMHPMHKETLQTLDIRLIASSPIVDEFDVCLSVCRTSSKSLLHETSYRSKYKYCFGKEAPPLKLLDLHVGR